MSSTDHLTTGTGRHVATAPTRTALDGRRKARPARPLAIGDHYTEYAASPRLAQYNATLRLFGSLDAIEAWTQTGGRVTFSAASHVDDELGVIVYRSTVTVTRYPALVDIAECA